MEVWESGQCLNRKLTGMGSVTEVHRRKAGYKGLSTDCSLTFHYCTRNEQKIGR